jgi:hypothetical protein
MGEGLPSPIQLILACSVLSCSWGRDRGDDQHDGDYDQKLKFAKETFFHILTSEI